MTTNRPIKKLWEIYDITSSKRVFQSERKKEWVPFYRAREIVKLAKNWYVKNELYISEKMYNEYSKKYWIPKENDIMVTWVGTIWICYFVKKDDKFYFKDGNIIWFKSKNDSVYSRFVEYLFQSNQVKNQINNSAWSVVATLTIEKAKNIQIPLPPLATQQLIVAKLDETFAQIDEAITTTQANIDQTDEMMKSVLDNVFEKGEWGKKSVKEISEKIQYWYTWKVVDKWIYRYLRITDIQNGGVERETVPFCDIEDTEAKKYLLNEWDIVFARTGATVWKSFLIDQPWVGHIFASYLIRIVSDKKYIFPKFLLYFFQSNKYRDQIFWEVVWAAQPNFNWNKLWEIVLPIPPLVKQQEIVSYLDDVFAQSSQLKEQYQKKLVELKELKASVLQSAFTGDLI